MWWRGACARGVQAEAIKVGLHPFRIGLMHDACSVLACEECDARYHLYYDSDAERSLTYWSLLAQEIITACHPHHANNVPLESVEKF